MNTTPYIFGGTAFPNYRFLIVFFHNLTVRKGNNIRNPVNYISITWMFEDNYIILPPKKLDVDRLTHEEIDNIFVFTDDLKEAFSDKYTNYCRHIFCQSGGAQLCLDDTVYNVVAGDCIICSTGPKASGIVCSDDFRMSSVEISLDYLEANSPSSEYALTGMLSTMQNPVFPMTTAEMNRCQRDIDDLRARTMNLQHLFLAETLKLDVQRMIFDIYDSHSRHLKRNKQLPTQGESLSDRFISLLSTGVYRKERRVDYYASRLAVSAKYLSEVCVKSTGHNASYWINWYTVGDISRQLQETKKSFSTISETFNFSSPAHFATYVRKHTNMSPTELRAKKKNRKTNKRFASKI